MKNSNFKKFALMGLLLASQAQVGADVTQTSETVVASNACGTKSCNGYRPQQGYSSGQQRPNYIADEPQRDMYHTSHMLTENDFRAKLSTDTKNTFDRLSPAGRADALRMYNDGTYKDVNEAVRAVDRKMSDKRNVMNARPAGGSY